MRRIAGMLLGAALVGALPAWPAHAAPAKAVCPVCRVTKGEADEEPVKVVRVHEGTSYGFCSEKCAKTFALDPAAYLPPVFPRPAPSFALQSLSGDSVSNGSLAGKVVLLDFWATWCAPCKKSMPELQAVHEKFASRGFSVLGVSIDEGGPDRVRKYVAAKKFSYPIVVDSGKAPAWEAFRVKAIPAAYLIDRSGRIVAQWTGAAVRPSELEARLGELFSRD